MGFIGSTSYYVLCVIALVILVSALIILLIFEFQINICPGKLYHVI